MKVCRKCQQEKPLSEFYAAQMNADGHSWKCKDCYKMERREHYHFGGGKEAERKRKARPEVIERKREQSRRSYQRTKGRLIPRARAINGKPGDLYYYRSNRAPGAITFSQWEKYVAHYGKNCLCCGSEAITIDHVIPVTMGGTSNIDNVQPLCQSCNSKKGPQYVDYRKDKGEYAIRIFLGFEQMPPMTAFC